MEYKETEKGRCLTCGFLSKHATSSLLPAPRFYEIESQERTSGSYIGMFQHIPDMAARARLVPTEIACFVGAFHLQDEIGPLNQSDIEKMDERARVAVDVIARNRECPEWYPYSPGHSKGLR